MFTSVTSAEFVSIYQFFSKKIFLVKNSEKIEILKEFQNLKMLL